MKEIFSGRRKNFHDQCLKYIRYVFNDHFIFFLLIFLSFSVAQYNQFIQYLPSNLWTIILLLILFSIIILPLGRIATYVEEPDKFFLLVKEEEIHKHLKRSMRRAFVFWVIVQDLFLLLLIPLFLSVGLPFSLFILYLLVMAVLKMALFKWKSRSFYVRNHLNWYCLISGEQKRKQTILRFLSLFVDVKGIPSNIKRRQYLDFLVSCLPKQQSNTWKILYLKSYARNGGLFFLTLRLTLLSVLVLLCVDTPWIASLLVLLLNYLLLFQLLVLYHAFDYHSLTYLFPLDETKKIEGVGFVIRKIMYSAVLLETICAAIVIKDKLVLLLILLGGFLLSEFYLPFKLRRIG